MTTIADTVRAALAAGKTTAEALEAVKAAHPNAKTSPACVAYYRSKMKKEGNKPAAKKAKPKTEHPSYKKPKPFAATAVGDEDVYSVKGVKTYRGMEGEGFNASLYRNGKRVALVIDDATGGPLMFEWLDHKPMDPRYVWIEVETKSYEGKPMTVRMSPEEKRLHDLVVAMPPRECEWLDDSGKPAMMSVTPESFVCRLVDDHVLLKDLLKQRQKGIAYIRDGGLYVVKAVPTKKNIDKLRNKHDGKVLVVLNGMSDAELLETGRALIK